MERTHHEGLPDFILDLLPLTQGGEPQEDDALILCIKEHGLNYERRQGEKKLAASASTSTSTSAGKSASAVEGALVPLLRANIPLALLLRSS